MKKRVDDRRFSARKALSMGFLTLVLMGGGILGWSVFASLSGAVIASGRLGVENRNQVVEHIDGGTVSRILVRDGDSVKKDDVLLRFDDALLRSEEAILESQYAELAARRNRLEAELKGADTIAWEKELAALSAADERVREVLEGHERLFRARIASRNGEVARLRERVGQTHKEIKGFEAQAVSLREQSELIFRQLRAYRDLFDQGLTSLDRLLSLERVAKSLEGQAGTTAAGIARARGRISELEIQILQVDARLIEEAEVRMIGAQATGCSPISTAWENGTTNIRPVKPNTIAKSLAIGNPADGYYALKTMAKTDGGAASVSDAEVVEGIQLLAQTEGVFAETAGGVTIAGLRQALERGLLDPDESTVAFITGGGLKTTDAVVDHVTQPIPVEGTLKSFEDAFAAAGKN